MLPQQKQSAILKKYYLAFTNIHDISTLGRHFHACPVCKCIMSFDKWYLHSVDILFSRFVHPTINKSTSLPIILTSYRPESFNKAPLKAPFKNRFLGIRHPYPQSGPSQSMIVCDPLRGKGTLCRNSGY